ncbi:pirin-like C-terminal cupin domain-containing protein [Bradyrhizobium commune]|uniref:pirin-like C-terminal cupin domain-containing protein n=1 Tax=Bradyrhizobium commune TaxID=83627 RepID=UPI001FEFB8F5|nr:pirin-like C-terminal cupin domain-containing protein [Bradyrhizobium commune]
MTIGRRSAPGGDLIGFADDGDAIAVEAPSDATLLFGHGDPIREPVVARGPFVMNTEAESIKPIAISAQACSESRSSIAEIA